MKANPLVLMNMAHDVATRRLHGDAALIFCLDPTAPLARQLSLCLPRLAQDALATGDDTTVLAFLQAGVPVDPVDLADVCEAGPRVVQALLDRQLDLAGARNALDQTPLHTALRWHDLKEMGQAWVLLLRAGVSPHAPDTLGRNAWQQAIDERRGITARLAMVQAGLPIPPRLAAVQGQPGPRPPCSR